jgi:hypothetical protein
MLVLWWEGALEEMVCLVPVEEIVVLCLVPVDEDVVLC